MSMRIPLVREPKDWRVAVYNADSRKIVLVHETSRYAAKVRRDCLMARYPAAKGFVVKMWEQLP